MDTKNLYTLLSDYRAAACNINDQLMRVHAKIVGLEYQVSIILLFCMCISNHTFNGLNRHYYFAF